MMLRTVEAVIDELGKVHLLEAIQLTEARKALVTIAVVSVRFPFAKAFKQLIEAIVTVLRSGLPS